MPATGHRHHRRGHGRADGGRDARRAPASKVKVYEQASQFTRIGSGIQMSPNAMKVLRAIGLEEQTREIAFRPGASAQPRLGHRARQSRLPVRRHGRRALRRALSADASRRPSRLARLVVPDESVSTRGKELVDFEVADDGVELYLRGRIDRQGRRGDRLRRRAFARAREAVRARESDLFGPCRLSHDVPGLAAQAEPIDDCTKWWGDRPPHRHLLHDRARRTKSTSSPRFPRPGLDRRNPGRSRRASKSSAQPSSASIRPSRGARRLPGGQQMGDLRARSHAELDRRATSC